MPSKKRKTWPKTQIESFIKNHVDDNDFLISAEVPKTFRHYQNLLIDDLIKNAEIVRLSQRNPPKTLMKQHVLKARLLMLHQRNKAANKRI